MWRALAADAVSAADIVDVQFASFDHRRVMMMGPGLSPVSLNIAISRLLVFSVFNLVQAFPNRIPIGALFDMESIQTRTAFRFEIDRHNNATSFLFRLDKNEKFVEIDDTFKISKTMCSVMSKGIFALFGVMDLSTISTTDSFTRTFNMPYVTPSAPINYLTDKLASSAAVVLTPPTTESPVHRRTQLGLPQYQPGTPPHFQPGIPPHLQPGGSPNRQPGSSPRHKPVHTPGYTLYMRPLYDRPIRDLVLQYSWSKLFYIYDTDEGLFRLELLYELFNKEKREIDVEPVRLLNVNLCYNSLRQIDARNDTRKHIVLDISAQEALFSVFRQIQNLGMHRLGYHYIIGGLSLDELDIDVFRYGGVNITGFRIVNPDLPSVQTLRKEWAKLSPAYWDGNEPESKIKVDAYLTMDAVSVIIRGLSAMYADNPNIFNGTFRRGQVYNLDTRGVQCRNEPPIPWTHGSAIMKRLRDVTFQGLTGHVQFDENGYRTNYALDVLELKFNYKLRMIGIWNSSHGLMMNRMSDDEMNSGNQIKSMNRTRIVTSIFSAPYLMIKNQSDDGKPLYGNDQYHGYCADVIKLIADKVGFSYTIRLVADGSYGQRTENGTWNGMVGELTLRKADIAVAPLTISSMRERVIDFSKPFMNLGISIMIKKPEKQKPGVFSFMEPLSYQIWICIVFSYLAVSLVLFLVSRFSPYNEDWQPDDGSAGGGPSFTNDFTMMNSLWFSLGAFMQQGCDISPRSVSGRLAGSVWWFFTLIIISTYTANLAAFLTVERMLTPINSVDDLAKQTQIQYGTLDSGSTKDFFKTSKIAVYEKMWSFMSTTNNVFVKQTEDGVERVRSSKGKYAFILESTMNDYYNQKKPCNTMKVGENLDSKGYGIATPIDSDLRDSVGLAVLQLRESGELQKLQKKWWYDKGECSPDADGKGGGSSQSALTLSNVAGIFYILISGLGLSMVVSLLEFICKSRSEAKKSRKTFKEFMKFKSRQLIHGDVTDDITTVSQCINPPTAYNATGQTVIPFTKTSVV